MPNALRVLVNLSHAVKRNSMSLSFEVGELEGLQDAQGATSMTQPRQFFRLRQ
jgi:hypothetical protein